MGGVGAAWTVWCHHAASARTEEQESKWRSKADGKSKQYEMLVIELL